MEMKLVIENVLNLWTSKDPNRLHMVKVIREGERLYASDGAVAIRTTVSQCPGVVGADGWAVAQKIDGFLDGINWSEGFEEIEPLKLWIAAAKAIFMASEWCAANLDMLKEAYSPDPVDLGYELRRRSAVRIGDAVIQAHYAKIIHQTSMAFGGVVRMSIRSDGRCGSKLIYLDFGGCANAAVCELIVNGGAQANVVDYDTNEVVEVK